MGRSFHRKSMKRTNIYSILGEQLEGPTEVQRVIKLHRAP